MAMPAPVPPSDVPTRPSVPTPPPGGWTIAAVHALPDDGNRYELLDGELFVTPAPALPHQRAIVLLLTELSTFVKRHGLGEVFASPADIIFSPHRLVQPDVFVVPPGTEPLRAWTDVRALRLAIEVLSPSTARADRVRKRAIYQTEGVPDYWIVDLDARLVERWRPGHDRPDVLHDALVWQPVAEGATLQLLLPVYFAMVHGEHAHDGSHVVSH